MAVRSGLRMHARTHEGGRIGRGEGFSLGARGRRTSTPGGKVGTFSHPRQSPLYAGEAHAKKKRETKTPFSMTEDISLQHPVFFQILLPPPPFASPSSHPLPPVPPTPPPLLTAHEGHARAGWQDLGGSRR